MTYLLVDRTKKQVVATLLILTTTILLTATPNTTATNQWPITVTNPTQQQTTLTYDQLTTLPATSVYAELTCYGSQVISGLWTGAKISDILTLANADISGGSVSFSAQDGYNIVIPMETAMQPEVILAYKLESDTLQETYRLVIPEANGNVWIAMVTSITVIDAGAPAVPEKSANLFDATKLSENNNQNTSPQQTPTKKPQPATPKPTQDTTVIQPTPTPTNQATPSPATTIPQKDEPQNTITLEPAYLAVFAVIAVALSVGLIGVAKQKQGKSSVH